jgi:chromate transporter
MAHIYDSLDRASQRRRLLELIIVFLQLGTIAFGGPAAHVAMMEAEVVTKRSWLSQEKLLELFGMTNLIPGPNSTELAMQIGYDRAGWRGLILAGLCFVVPATTIVWLLAMLYVQTRTLPQLDGLLYGIKPVIVAIVGQALWNMSRKAWQDWATGIAGGAAMIGYFFGLDEIAILAGMGILVWVVRRRSALQAWFPISGLLAQSGSNHPITNISVNVNTIDGINIFLVFLKIGAVLYGGGYVLVAFLQRELVDRNGWITSQQLLDAVAVGQLTPGPILTTATFVGYLLAGNSGAVLATVGIFLPSFLFVGILNTWVMSWTRSVQFQAFLSGVTAASVGLMAGVSVTLAQTTWVDGWTVGMSVLAAIVLVKFKINSAYLVVLGGTIGLLIFQMR